MNSSSSERHSSKCRSRKDGRRGSWSEPCFARNVTLLPAQRVDVLHTTRKFTCFLARELHADPLCGARLFRQAEARAPFDYRPHRARRESSAAVGAHIVQHVLDALGAERAFVSANARVGRVRRQILVAAFAVRSQLEHWLGSRWCSVSRAAAASTAPRRFAAVIANRSRTRARIAGGAVSGTPESKGGAGAYSIRSWIAWAVSGPTSSATALSAKSIPAVTPPP